MAEKFSRCGPEIIARPQAAGSSRLCPPRRASVPPMNTTSASGNRLASSPIESSSIRHRQREVRIDSVARPPEVADSGSAQALLGGIETLGLARNQDEQQSRMISAQVLTNASMTAWSSSTSPASAAGMVLAAIQTVLGRRRSSRSRISFGAWPRMAEPRRTLSFQIPRRAQDWRRVRRIAWRPARSARRSHPDTGARAKEEAPAPVTRKCAVGNAAVDDHQRASGALHFAIQHRPDFSFQNHHHAGPDPRRTRRTANA